MQLWQMDITGSVFLTDGTELKLISGIDDHSRFCVIATVVRRGTARAVCRAFITAMRTYGIPDEVLTDNGKQFTGRFGKPRPAEVLFERICRRNGIRQLLTKPYSPTTTGKVERWHQTLQVEFLDDAGPFASIEEAQAAVDAWREEYNHRRPHQSLDMACPADKFRPLQRPVTAWSCGRQPTWSPSPLRCQHRMPCCRRRRASELAGCHRDRPGGPAVGEHDDRAAAVLAGHQPDRPDGQLLDRHHHRAPEHRRVADQDRAVPAVRSRPRPAPPQWRPPGRTAPGRTRTRSPGRDQLRGSAAAGQRRRDHHPRQPGHPGRLPAGRAARPHPPGRPGHARHHPGRRLVAHPALPHPARPAAPAPGRPPRRARPAASSPT